MTDPRSVSCPKDETSGPNGHQATAQLRRVARPRAENAVAGLACVEAYGWHREPTPSAVSTLRAALATNVAASAAPYGYTVTLWSSGAILMASHGMPHVAEVFAFLAGALAGFGLMATLAQRSLGRAELLGDAVDRVRAGSLDVLAVGGAVGAVALVAEIHSWEAWPLGAFAATALYLLGASVQLTVVARRRRRTARTSGAPGPD